MRADEHVRHDTDARAARHAALRQVGILRWYTTAATM
jgi:hypothetical protein